jgi:hypothetical protein
MPLSEEDRAKIIAATDRGMPLQFAARLVKSTASAVRAEMQRNRGFATAVYEAEAKCMDECLAALKGAKQWQANTFILESRWPGQFRRNRKLPEPVAQTPLPLNDERLGRLDANDFSLLTYLWDKMNGRPTVLEIPDIPSLRNRRTPPFVG